MRTIGEVVRVDHSDAEVAIALLELQRRAYEVEAALIGSRDIPPLIETLEELQNSRETFLAVSVEGRIAGTVSYRLLRDTIDIHRLAVDPTCFRCGIGTALVRAAVRAEPSATHAIVQTGAGNEPARSLYLREGFEQTDELEVAPGLRVTRYRMRLR
ncbi:MAG: GNAT family N-acetyltransferase [Actinobacteria bacterium]|nr:GNAT family N-acetyltransferase [Actinomycetota bacterium]